MQNSFTKRYIFFTPDIHVIGGAQMFIATRAKYLEERGWKINIIFGGSNTGECKIPYLTQFVKGGIAELEISPCKMRKARQDEIIDDMLNVLNLDDNVKEIIIESHDDRQSFWGELLAARIKARHFIVLTNEIYRDSYRRYADNLDFFEFKYKRNEILAPSYRIKRLFDGYKGIVESKVPNILCVSEGPVQDIDHDALNLIKNADWNICYIGRAAKQYVPHVIRGVYEFAYKHPQKKIQFIMVGDASCRLKQINETLGRLDNVIVTLLGDLVPIPRKLYSKIDVVIANSGAAFFSAHEGVLTITANEDTEFTPGVLFYDTDETLFGEERKLTYCEALEKLLIEKAYDNRTFHPIPKLNIEEMFDNYQLAMEHADKSYEYYDKKLSRECIRTWIAIFPFGKIERGSNIVIYGAGDCGRDYYYQIQNNKYCNVVCFVDKRHEQFGNNVKSPLSLLELRYDYVVIASVYENIALEIKDYMTKELQINEDKIVWDNFLMDVRI